MSDEDKYDRFGDPKFDHLSPETRQKLRKMREVTTRDAAILFPDKKVVPATTDARPTTKPEPRAEAMKTKTFFVGLLVGIGLAISIWFVTGSRYDLKRSERVNGSMRIDRWTGKTQVLVFSAYNGIEQYHWLDVAE